MIIVNNCYIIICCINLRSILLVKFQLQSLSQLYIFVISIVVICVTYIVGLLMLILQFLGKINSVSL